MRLLPNRRCFLLHGNESGWALQCSKLAVGRQGGAWMVMVRYSDNRSDKELLERELKAAESAVEHFGNQAIETSQSLARKSGSFLFGKRNLESAGLIHERGRTVVNYY